MCGAWQGDVFTDLQRKGGELPERTAIVSVIQPLLSVLMYLHDLVSTAACRIKPKWNQTPHWDPTSLRSMLDLCSSSQ